MTKYFPQSSVTKYHANDQRQRGITALVMCRKRLKRKHDAENIRHEYEETVTCYEIADKICSNNR